MNSGTHFVLRAKAATYGCAILALLFSLPGGMHAQYAPVPTSFQPIYTELNNYLFNFNATLPPGSNPAYPTAMTLALKAADANNGVGLLNNLSGTQLVPWDGIQLQLNALKASGAQAIMVEVGFPMLYAPFLNGQNSQYQQEFTSLYQAVAAAIRQAGLKLVVENDSLMVNDVAANWDVAPFFATLNWTEYQAARAQTALTIAQVMQPDYLVVLQEPQTEAANSGQSSVNTVTGSVSMLTEILASVQQAGVPGMKVGAGTGASQVNPNAMEFIPAYVAVPLLDYIDIHIYPINDAFLPTALQMASTAAAANLPVAMSECWMWKVLDTELNILSPDEIRGRDPFSFWAPLDAYFVQTMQSLANTTQMMYQDFFGSEYFFVYQTYGPTTENLTPSAILSQENQLVQADNTNAQGDTTTGMAFYNSIVVPPDTTPPSTPTALAGVSSNPTETSLSWNPATDQVGVVGYYILRDGVNIATTGTLYFQDSGLTEATTYTYTVEAFDLAGNVSAPSAPVSVQTINVTPPTTPGNVTVTASACTKATLKWSPSTDNTGITEYLVWMGLSANALTQVAVAGGSATSYGNSNLSPATTYFFGVQAEDKNHNISYMSTIVSVTTPALPVAPPSVTAKPLSTTKVSVTWTSSPSAGGLSIAHYMVYKGTSASSLSQVATVNNTSYNDTTDTASTTYYYAVQATDSGQPPSQSGLSATVSATTYAPPSVPLNLTATPLSCTKVSLTWAPAVSGGLPLGNYHVFKGTTASNMTQLALTPNTTYTDITDTTQSTYYYAVQSSDNAQPADLSAISPPVSVTTDGDPSVPANLTATPVSSSKITLTWSPAVSGGLPIGNYHVYGGTSPTGLSQLAVTPNLTYNNMSLTPGKTYYYAVQAADTANDDSPLSPTVSATTFPLPTTPSNVVAQGTSSSEIAVSWAPSSGTLPIAHYFVFRGTSPAPLSKVATTNSPSYNDRSVSAGTTYYYGIQAADTANDDSATSAPVAGTTQP
jgi:fibronectin type 3 domain-containing protein